MDNKRKICFVVAQPGTAKSFFKDHIERLSELFDVYLVANIKDVDDLSSLNLKGTKSIQIERRPSLVADIKSLWLLYRYFRKEKFFCVHSMASKPSLLMSIAAFVARVPHRIRIFTGQLWCNMKGWKRHFFKTIDRITVALNTELMVDGLPQMQFLEEQGIFRKGAAQVMANGSICGVDTKKFVFSEHTRTIERQKLNFRDEIVYIFVGRMKKEKGIYELFSAMNKLVQEYPKAKLLLVGADEENTRNSLKDYANLIDGKNVIYYGYTNSPQTLLQVADVFVMPSYREGFGMSVLEASCLNLPVICSDIYGMRDTMIDNVTGIRCKVMDSDSLYGAMQILYNNEALRLEMGKNGHDYVINRFTKKQVTDAWFEYYKSLK